jgi:SAM-dependent methyltransferase
MATLLDRAANALRGLFGGQPGGTGSAGTRPLAGAAGGGERGGAAAEGAVLAGREVAVPHDAGPGGPSYETRLQAEIARYRQVENVHDLPGIFHVWSRAHVGPKMQAVFGLNGFDRFYTRYIRRYAADHPGRLVEVASLGAGNGDLEVGLGRLLRDGGLTDFRFRCLDVNPDMLARGREHAAAAGLAEHYRFEEADAARWRPEGPLAAVMAHQSLHHFVELEAIFANVKAAIGDDGYFLVNDMIGRNGHMRWPEALDVVHAIWRDMPDRYKYNHQLKRVEPLYENWDCSREGFEGIRAQDILPLLLEAFHFEAFVAFGNVINIFVDRGFGHNFDPDDPADVAFIERIGALDEELIDAGTIKPTQMVAVMRGRPVTGTRCYRHWTPEFCVRRP